MTLNEKIEEQERICALRERLELQRKTIDDHLKYLQQECSHLRAVSVPRADTGNYCKADDRYWYEHSCPDCGKKWTTDQ